MYNAKVGTAEKTKFEFYADYRTDSWREGSVLIIACNVEIPSDRFPYN